MAAGSGLMSKQRAAVTHLAKPGGGVAGEVYDLRKDVAEELGSLAGLVVEEFTNLIGAAAPGAAVLKAATATVASPVTHTTADLLDAGEAMLLAWPRQLTFTTAGTPADAPANVVITGTDYKGAVQSETLNLAQTAAAVTSVNAYRTITSLAYPAADGTAATIAVGIAAGVLKGATATVTTAVVLNEADLNQAVLQSAPRQLVFTTAGATPAHAPANVLIEGYDVLGRAQSETLSLAQTATTATSVKFYARIKKLTYAAGDGTAATIAISVGVPVGLARKIKTRAGVTGLIRELANAAVVTNGTIVDAATAIPNGSYSPNSAPNDASDYAIYYDADFA